MDAKAFAFILVLLFVGAFGGIIYETTAIDEINRELQTTNLSLSNLENHIKGQTEYLELRKEAFALTSALEIIRKEADALHGEVEELRQRKTRTEKSLLETVLKTREDSAGLQLGDITLANGTILKNSRVNKVDGTITSILHSEGIVKLEPSLLPKELKDRFRFEISDESSQLPVSKKPEVEVPSNGAISPKQARLNSAKLGLEKLQMELSHLERDRAQAQTDSSSTSPTRRYYAKKREDAYNQQANSLRRRIDEATLEVRKAEQALGSR